MKVKKGKWTPQEQSQGYLLPHNAFTKFYKALCNFNLLSKCRGSTSVQKKSDGC